MRGKCTNILNNIAKVKADRHGGGNYTLVSCKTNVNAKTLVEDQWASIGNLMYNYNIHCPEISDPSAFFPVF